MTNDEVLAKVRKFVEGKARHSVADTEDAWRHEVQDLLPLYLQFQILDLLDSIDSRLIALEDVLEHKS